MHSHTGHLGAPVGDPAPPAVARFLDAVAGGRPADAAGAFADDALYAYWDGSGEETAPRLVVEGRSAIREVLDASAAGRPELLSCIHEARDCFVEGRLVSPAGGEPAATFAANLQLDGDGLITRHLSYHCPPVEPSATWPDAPLPSPGDALAILDTYFEHLGAARFAEAVACFSEDCLYSHPPYGPGRPRMEFRGHAELLAGFEKRGPRNWDHEIVSCLQCGPECLIEGVVHSVPGGGSFISSMSLAGDGRIWRYVAFYCSPLVPRR
jgi:hypothetical protein